MTKNEDTVKHAMNSIDGSKIVVITATGAGTNAVWLRRRGNRIRRRKKEIEKK